MKRTPPAQTLPLILIALVLIGTSCATLDEPSAVAEPAAESTIVQGPTFEAARDAVLAVGGTVTHELGIIRSVGATLTQDQRARIATAHPEIRMQADRVVKVQSELPDPSTCGLSGAGEREISGDKFTWSVSNPGSSDLRLDQVEIQWPVANGFIQKAKFRGRDLLNGAADGPSLTLTGPLSSNPDDLTLEPGKTEKLELEFGDDLPDFNQANYYIVLTFEEETERWWQEAETCTVVFRPDELSCRVEGTGDRKLDGNKFEWDMTNTGTGAISIQAVSINWPERNGWIEMIRHEGGELYKDLVQPPVATVVGPWLGDLSRRTIKPGDDGQLKLEFENEISIDEEAYLVTVEFAEGCSTTFVANYQEPPEALKGDKKARQTVYPETIRADDLHEQGYTGEGTTIAVVDTGLWVGGRGDKHLRHGGHEQNRVLAVYDAVNDILETDTKKAKDGFGHGSHVTSIAASARKTWGSNGYDGRYNGVAPNADLLVVSAFDSEGKGTYMDAIRGIQFVVNHRDTYGVRVMNLSFSGTPISFYWNDPLNQAVMAAWQAGIVVVASAGNSGPDPMTIGVPGNVPYVITVGAMSDATTTSYEADDFLATFSSTGPTYEGFVKPEVVAPGGHILGLTDGESWLGKNKKIFHDGDGYFYMSGTSQAAAVVSGAAALLLEANPGLTPDEVKCRLMATARPATSDGKLAYTVFQQGAGLIDVAGAAETAVTGCANQGLDLAADLAGEKHYGGRANVDGDGNYCLMEVEGDGYLWPGGYLWPRATVWSDGYLWPRGYLWSQAYLWSNGNYDWYLGDLETEGYLWPQGFLWPRGYLWSQALTETMSTNFWVPQE